MQLVLNEYSGTFLYYSYLVHITINFNEQYIIIIIDRFSEMGDSDDERDYRRRDKFHNERRGGGGYDDRRGGYEDRFGGDDWREPPPRSLPPPTYASGFR